MKISSLENSLWGHKSKLGFLLLAAVFLLFAFLGGREIWTQEHRWADVVSGMFYRHDFLHPFLGQAEYYDKPLLSYWLIALLAKISGSLTTWTLRIPSALAGLLAIWSVYTLGTAVKDRQLGLLSGWLLLTTFYFVFWARTSSADMLNLAGSTFAIAWYINKREHAGFLDYAVFFLIVALTSLCKGLVGAIVPAIAVLTDIVLQKSWKQHLRAPLWWAMLPALVVYLTPFVASSYFSTTSFDQNGLYLVYRENILRYFKPFDHQGPIYTYFIYLPIYLLPWALFFVPALIALKSRWATLNEKAKWVAFTLLALFLFFTLSGSRRSYYVLPLVPFAIIFIAEWILSGSAQQSGRRTWASRLIATTFIALFLLVDVVPVWYYSEYGVGRFASTLKAEASKIKPWNTWNVVTLDAESKLNFYLQLPPDMKTHNLKGDLRTQQSSATLLQAWPILENKPSNTIFITRKLYVPSLQPYFHGYRLVELQALKKIPFTPDRLLEEHVAYIPE